MMTPEALAGKMAAAAAKVSGLPGMSSGDMWVAAAREAAEQLIINAVAAKPGDTVIIGFRDPMPPHLAQEIRDRWVSFAPDTRVVIVDGAEQIAAQAYAPGNDIVVDIAEQRRVQASEFKAGRDQAQRVADELRAQRNRLRVLVREALCESEMDSGQIAQWLHDHGVPDLDELDDPSWA